MTTILPLNDDAQADGSEFKLDDATSYDDVALDFEWFTERCSLPLAEQMINLSSLGAPSTILDVGCGTGVVTRLAARRFPAAQVTGVDLSDGMLRRAAELTRRDGVDQRVLLLKQDAENLDLPDSSFDCILSLFALRHFPNPMRALGEMQRVARPGARVVVAVGSAPPLLSFAGAGSVVRNVFETLLGLAGRAPLKATAFLEGLLDRHLGDAPRAQDAAWTRGTTQSLGRVAGMMQAAGFGALHTKWIGQASENLTADEFWRLQATFSSRARKRIAHATPTQVASLRSAFDSACERHLARGGRLVYRSGALVTAAVAGTRRYASAMPRSTGCIDRLNSP